MDNKKLYSVIKEEYPDKPAEEIDKILQLVAYFKGSISNYVPLKGVTTNIENKYISLAKFISNLKDVCLKIPSITTFTVPMIPPKFIEINKKEE